MGSFKKSQKKPIKKPKRDKFLEALLEFQKEVTFVLDRMVVDHQKILNELGPEDKKDFEQKYPNIIRYINKRTAENWCK